MVLNHSLFSVVTCTSHSVGIWIIVICFYARAWTVQLLSSEAKTFIGTESKVHEPKGYYKFIKAEVSLVAAAGGSNSFSNSFSTGTKLLFIDDESALQCSMLPRYPPLGL
ncbi:hypothetical protein D5086_015284 [Populus alba]|uniref:Uncharacterized protein n=1 Tax=Populus alba TaxID=43335 RepID=A0ACC4C2R1_POPAL